MHTAIFMRYTQLSFPCPCIYAMILVYGGDEMQHLFLRDIFIDWKKVTDYTQGIAALHSFDTLKFHKQITFLTGENGYGKSTLLEAIAVAYGFNPEGGTKNYRFYTRDTHSSLYEGIHMSRGPYQPSCSYFLRAESFYNVATKAEDYESTYQGRALHSCSHGESFLSFMQSFRDVGFFLLDEPEAALSVQRQLALLIQLTTMATEGSQFLIATHSPILLGVPDAQILSFDDGRVEEITYEQTASYQITEMFINNRDYMLDKLLREDDI